jgi:hypothetical protein
MHHQGFSGTELCTGSSRLEGDKTGIGTQTFALARKSLETPYLLLVAEKIVRHDHKTGKLKRRVDPKISVQRNHTSQPIAG